MEKTETVTSALSALGPLDEAQNEASDVGLQKLAFLGGDADQRSRFVEEGKKRGVTIEAFDSTLAFGSVGRFREYEAAIVHETLSPLTGHELAEYLDKLFSDLPMVLLPADKEEADVVQVLDRLLARLEEKPKEANQIK